MSQLSSIKLDKRERKNTFNNEKVKECTYRLSWHKNGMTKDSPLTYYQNLPGTLAGKVLHNRRLGHPHT